MNKTKSEIEITLKGEQVELLHEICIAMDSKEYDEKLHLIGMEACNSEADPPASAIGEFFEIKRRFVGFISSVQEEVRQVKRTN